MRASKESTELVRTRVDYLERKMGDNATRQTAIAFEEIRQFLNSAHRKLPTEAAYEKDRRRPRRRA